MSRIKKCSITINGTHHLVTVTAVRTTNDINGNPQYLLTVWTQGDNGHIWNPKLKGYRDRNDQSYKVQSHAGIDGVIPEFINDFANQMNAKYEEM